ncbi:amidohydrolase family protein [Nocardia mangyaensis]|uniref:amidohydrolase family protein n=1 Tax=Nocardia mangyaensis TaxID=2213200 RepID=UPI0026773E04|nr:amidohydrolase family protein [Nocardia mangyaensis]MDO3646901.1 amidohydrolase family protein [Nocardia mangyaensis]
MLIRRARVFGTGHTDVRWHRGSITECGTGLRPFPGEDDIDADGGWLLPGLHDHHVHLRSLAASADSLQLGPLAIHTVDELAARLRQADATLPKGAWIRGVGYHESAAGELDRWTLDRLIPGRPVRIQHRSGALWTLNSRACAAVELERCTQPGVERDLGGRANGRLWRMDAWLGAQIAAKPVDLTTVSARAATLGITGVTDATPALAQHDIDDFARDVTSGRIQQRVHCMAPPAVTAPEIQRFSLGPTKILLDDTALPTLDQFIARIREIHAGDRSVAVHCVTRVQLILTMTALDGAGVRLGDRIEHGAIVPVEAMAWLRANRVPVVTQPHFLVERSDHYRRAVPDQDRPDLWRLGSLLRARVGVAGGTDAPFGSADPWRLVHAAVDRESGRPAAERLSLRSAVSLFFGRPERPASPRTIAPGEVADLTLLAVPPEEVTAMLPNPPIAATVVDGRVVYG